MDGPLDNPKLIDLRTVTQYGAKGDAVILTACVMTSGSAVLTSSSASFTSADVGKTVSVEGAGPNALLDDNATTARFPLITTISSVQTSTQVTLAAAAQATVNGNKHTLRGEASSGTFRLRYLPTGERAKITTDAIAYNASAATILSTIDAAFTAAGYTPPFTITASGGALGTSDVTIDYGTPFETPEIIPSITGGEIHVYSYRVVYGTNDTAAIQAAVSSLASLPGRLVFRPGRLYLTTGRVTVYNARYFTIDGNFAQIICTAQERLFVHNCDDFRIEALGYQHAARPGRTGYSFEVTECNRFKLDMVSVENSSGQGIYISGDNDDDGGLGSSKGILIGCHVRKTNADGTHITAGSRQITIVGCHNDRIGDDGFAVVSYEADVVQCNNVAIVGCTVLGGADWNGGRGITSIGSRNVTAVGNAIEGTSYTGIYSAEDASYNTFAPQNFAVAGNVLWDVGAGGNLNQTVTDGIAALSLTGGAFSGNAINRTGRTSIHTTACFDIAIGSNVGRNAGLRGVAVNGEVHAVTGNVVDYTGEQAYLANDFSMVTLVGNIGRQANQNQTAGVGGVFFTGTSFGGTCLGNAILDAEAKMVRPFQILSTCTGMTFGGNLNSGGLGVNDTQTDMAFDIGRSYVRQRQLSSAPDAPGVANIVSYATNDGVEQLTVKRSGGTVTQYT